MKKFTNPLDKIKIASPCAANWNEMIGDNRQRHCAECKLNVYNLSDMTRREAENFLINAEGRVCLRIYRRSDGTVITRNCPKGLAMLKKKVSRAATAVFTMLATFFGGVFALESLKTLREFTNYDKVPEIFFESENYQNYNSGFEGEDDETISFGGITTNLPEIKMEIFKSRNF